MAQNSSGKRGNAPQVAVVIGVVLILIGAWNLVNVLVPAAAISSLINFIRHLWNVVWPCGLLAPAGICCGRLNLESCRALRSLATMRRFAARAPTSASSAYAAESRITLASTLQWSHYRGYSARRISSNGHGGVPGYCSFCAAGVKLRAPFAAWILSPLGFAI